MTALSTNAKPVWPATLATLTLLLGWAIYWYWETVAGMAQIWWRSDTYAHGLIVPPIVLWLIWRKRPQLARLQPTPVLWAAVPVAGFVFLWLLGDLAAVNALTQFAVIGVAALSVVALVGLGIGRHLAFPLIFLFFSVPIGDFLLPRLMEWTADFTVIGLRLSGIPVYREGQQFVIPSGNWSVVEACSGIRYLIASLTIGTLYAYLTYRSLKRRLIFVAVSLIVPIVANWLRAYLIVMLGHLSGNRLAVGVDHLIYGWVFFGIVIAALFAIGMRWAEPVSLNSAQDATERTASRNHSLQSGSPRIVLHGALLALLIATGPLIESRLGQPVDQVIRLELPDATGDWQRVTPPIVWQPQFAAPSAELRTAYQQHDHWVGIYIAYYRNQNYERKLITSTNVLASSNDPDWQIVSRRLTSAKIAGENLAVRDSELRQKHGGIDQRYLVRQWYWINGHLTSSEIQAKWLTAWSVLTGHGDDSAVVILYAPNSDQDALSAAADLLGTVIHHALATAKQQ